MSENILSYLLYGFISGLGELLPVSPTANGYLLQTLTQFDARNPGLLLFVHLGCLIALILCYFRKIDHMRREVRIAAQPASRRKRQPDMTAVLDYRVIFASLIPLLTGAVLSGTAYRKLAALPLLSVLLVLGGVIVYIPQFLPGANKDSRLMSRKDSLILGFSGALGVIPGFSRIGTMISVGLMKGCDRSYILDIAMLASVPFLLGMILVDVVMLIMAGVVLKGIFLLSCLMAMLAAFVGAWIAMLIMRYLSVESNFNAFAYFNWGVAVFAFLVYLVI